MCHPDDGYAVLLLVNDQVAAMDVYADEPAAVLGFRELIGALVRSGHELRGRPRQDWPAPSPEMTRAHRLYRRRRRYSFSV